MGIVCIRRTDRFYRPTEQRNRSAVSFAAKYAMSHEGFTMEKGILAFYLPPWRSGGLAGTKVTSTEPHLIRIHDLTPERIPSSNTYVGMVDGSSQSSQPRRDR